MSDSSNAVKEVAYSFPTPQHPCYHQVLTVEMWTESDWQVERVLTNGRRTRDFWVYNDGEYDKNNIICGTTRSSIVVRVDWKNSSNNRLEVNVVSKSDRKKVTLKSSSRSPSYGGYWNSAWKYYASVVLTENAGWPRESEPVHFTLGTYADRLTDPAKEIRVVEVDPWTGMQTEIPSQVSAVSSWSERKDERGQPTTSFDVTFLANVLADSSKVYLIFYGNPRAKAPQYTSDLLVSGEGYGLTVENSFYKMHFQDMSGSIDEVYVKQGINKTLEHRLETNGAVQWNPDCYGPPRPWIHVSDWDPPDGYSRVDGPVFLMTNRWGQIPHYPEINVSITYIFYANNPYLTMITTMDVVKDVHLKALRNGEFVFNHEIVKEAAWRSPDGSIGSMVIKDGPRHPKHAVHIEADSPWIVFYGREHQCGFGGITLQVANVNRKGGILRAEPPYTYVAWGPWVYWSRVFIYPFGSNNPQRMILVPEGSTYHDKMAIIPFRLGDSEETLFDPLDECYERLSNPLDIRLEMDTDDRVPEEWVPPILTMEFEEMED